VATLVTPHLRRRREDDQAAPFSRRNHW
jgi:hypothetical protein